MFCYYDEMIAKRKVKDINPSSIPPFRIPKACGGGGCGGGWGHCGGPWIPYRPDHYGGSCGGGSCGGRC